MCFVDLEFSFMPYTCFYVSPYNTSVLMSQPQLCRDYGEWRLRGTSRQENARDFGQAMVAMCGASLIRLLVSDITNTMSPRLVFGIETCFVQWTSRESVTEGECGMHTLDMHV